jgi:RNA-binding protein 26
VQNAPLEGRSATRLVIDKIPQDSCSISTVNEYFSRFGTIVNITVQPELQRARLEYATHEQANSAYTSPEVIFGNRFVKVYWDSEDLSTPNVRQASSTFTFARPIAPVIPPRVEALQKKQEALRGMLELQKQKQELLTKYIAEQKELLEKLENKTLSDIERQGITKTLQGIEELIKSLNPPPVKKVSGEESSGKLAEINPSQTTGPILRGGPMTRGRGGGRGGIVNAFTSRSAHRLDLRPTAFLMSPIPSRVGREINSIKKLFEPYGEIKNITLAEDGSGAIISFVRRADAEKALFYMPKTDLGEPFTLDWVAPATPSPALSNASAPVEMNPTDVMGGEGEGEDEDDIPEHIAFEEEAHWKR